MIPMRPDAMQVVKIGGSLLDLPDLPKRLDALRRALEGPALYLVGGGETAEVVRRFDRDHHLGDQASHWLAIRAMAFNAHLLRAIWPDDGIIDPLAWLEQEHQQGISTPHDWRFTSDSIAAHLTRRINAGKLILAKSVDWPDGDGLIDMQNISRLGLVDECFPIASKEIPRLDWVNLRRWPMTCRTIR